MSLIVVKLMLYVKIERDSHRYGSDRGLNASGESSDISLLTVYADRNC